MNTTALLAAAVALIAMLSPASAQTGRPTTEKDVSPLTQPIVPAPSNNRIVIGFGEQTRIHFKRAFKSVRIGDVDVVSAFPESDHLVQFTGLAPGMSTFSIEASDGSAAASGEIIVIRDVHEVKVYYPSASSKKSDSRNAGVTINVGDNNTQDAKKSAEAEYSNSLCNEVGCRPVPEPAK
jgi:Flp pilus assembly secretin CpaC